MSKLVLLRHGQSQWNLDNRFTGWYDVDLTERGIKEGQAAGKAIKDEGISFDVAFTSVLKRAIRTLWLALDEMDQMWVPVNRSWKLNERHYGALQGLNKIETVEKFGEEQVNVWRRSFSTPPEPVDENSEHHPKNDSRYKDLKPEELPATESLEITLKRVIPYWEETILPELKKGKNVVVAAHGNSLRALVMHLDNMSEDEIVKLNIPTGIPLLYEFDENMKATGHRYLGDPEALKAAQDEVANQTKKS